MRKLSVYIEINGETIHVGTIQGNSSTDAAFSYSENYINNSKCKPISISLPFQIEPFNPMRTRNYFEGLLPEGFTRRCVAERLQADENDYLTILAALGKECIGALKIVDDDYVLVEPNYIILNDNEVAALAKEGAKTSANIVTKSHLSLTGASGKVGLYYNESDRRWYLPIGDAPSTHIVKQSHVRLERIVVNEQLCLLTAKKMGIEVPESFIINRGMGRDEDLLFATKRYDREINVNNNSLHGMVRPYRLHQEDFAQALGISAYDKYEKNDDNYLKRVFEIIKNYSSSPIEDQVKLWDICIFNYLIGNTDNHIKNISLLYSADMKSIRLAPAYDIVSTMVYKSSTDNMSLSIGGEYNINKITKSSFEKEAFNVGLGVKLAMKRFDKLVNEFEQAIIAAQCELKEQGYDFADEVSDKILNNCRGI